LDLITLQEYGKICEQPIEFGENLLDYAENVSANELYTCVIPKGARLEKSPIEGLEAYVDITSVNGGKDYLYSADAVAAYGWNRCVVSWDDVTEPANLKKKGEKWLKDNQFETMTLSLTAADMSLLDTDLESFELGDSVPVYSESHGMDRTFPVQSLELHLQNPSDDKLQLGSTMKLSYTEQNKGHYQYIEQALENNRQTTSWLQSAIDNATAMMTGSRGGYKVTEFDEKGRWLRDLYMNAPSKEDATQVMQINMNGIGFSRNGFGGPYKNAWTIDGVLLGEFIKAGSVQAEALSAEYKTSVTNEINTMVTAKFKVAENLVQAEVTRAKGAEETLRSSLSLT
ncbi:MAG: phage tail spike protein, partial [Blautia sp.]